MSEDEAFALLYFGIRLSVAGRLVHTVDLLYNKDGNPGPTDINTHPYSHDLTIDGHPISLLVKGKTTTTEGDVAGRFYTITSDAPFWIRYTSQMGQVITYSASSQYDIVMDTNYSPAHLGKGDNSITYDLTADLISLWTTSTIPDRINFGGIVYANIDFCTHRILRHPTTGVILRHPSTGVILRDD